MKRTLLSLLCIVSSLQAKPLKFIWNANPEADIARYVLKIGTTSNVYTQTIDTGLTTSQTVDLGVGTYYAVCVVYNTEGNSAQSAEISTTVAADVPPTFEIGDDVTTGANRVNVRASFGLSGEFIITQPVQSTGKIVDGFEQADGFIWWLIAWEDGTQGWSGQDLLTKKDKVVTIPLPESTTVRYVLQVTGDLETWEDVAVIIRPKVAKEFVRIKIIK